MNFISNYFFKCYITKTSDDIQDSNVWKNTDIDISKFKSDPKRTPNVKKIEEYFEQIILFVFLYMYI